MYLGPFYEKKLEGSTDSTSLLKCKRVRCELQGAACEHNTVQNFCKELARKTGFGLAPETKPNLISSGIFIDHQTPLPSTKY